MTDHKKRLIFTSLLILCPILVGLLLWNRLPAEIATHFGFGGVANGWSSKGFAVFGIPLFVLACHLLCAFVTRADPKNENRNGKVQGLVLWICPAVSWFAAGLMYSSALGGQFDMDKTGVLFLGVLFLVWGNYLPKCQQNSTVGIKLPWTLWDEEIWNATHRLGGKIWVAGGAFLLVSALFPAALIPWVLVVAILVIALVPCGYSYWLWRKKVKRKSKKRCQ